MNLGEAIKHFRNVEGLTQRALAGRVGVTPAYLSQIENGHRDPGTGLTRDICRVLDIPAEVLFWEAIRPAKLLSSAERRVLDVAESLLQRYYEARGITGVRGTGGSTEGSP